MKRHMKMSLVLVTLLLTLGILLTGCGTEELQTQIDDNAAKADSSIKDVAADVEAAEKALDDAVAELEALIAAGDKADADKLAEAITAVNSAIDAAKKAATDGDADLQDAIDAAEAAIEAAKNAWNDATDAIVAALAKIQGYEYAFEAAIDNYGADKVIAIENAFDVAWVKVVRALDEAAVEAAIEELEAVLGANPTLTGEIYNLLNKILEDGIVCTPAEKDDATDLAATKALIDLIKNGTNDALKAELNAYGADSIPLEAKYIEYKEAYDAAVAKLAGEVIKAEMDELNKNAVTYETDINVLNATYAKFDAWEKADGNDYTKIEGFVATVETFVANMNRVADLKYAEAEAKDLNDRIDDLAASITEFGAVKSNYDMIQDLKADAADWVAAYFSGNYAAEIDANSINYQLLNHEGLKAACDAFDALLKDAMTAAADFILAVKSVGDINLLSWDEIELAQTFYLAWINEQGVNSFDYMFNVDETPDDYFATLANYVTKFDALQAAANNAYVAAKTTADTINATTINLYSTELDALIKWYADYTFVDGVATFENTTFAGVEGFSEKALAAFGDVEDGYKLDKNLVVTAEDYADLMELKAVKDKLIADKNAETTALIEQINAIGFVSIAANEADSTEGAVKAARDAYDTWKSGTDADQDGIIQNAVADGCTTFVVTNYATLTAAEAKIVELKDLVADIKAGIALLVYTDAGMDLADLPNDFDSAAYLNAVKALNNLYAEFVDATTGNNGNRGMITEEELAKLAAAELIVTKYEALLVITDIYETKLLEVAGDAQKAADLKSTLDMNKDLIEIATDVDDIIKIVERAAREFDAVINGEILD